MTTTPTRPLTVENQGKLWMRDARLIFAQRAATATQTTLNALDLSKFHFRFSVNSSDLETPNLLSLRVYNLAPETITALVKEYDQVSLEAGYRSPGTYGIIFSGTIRQFKFGKESITDDFLEIIAGDNDIGYNYGFINTTLDPDVQLANWEDVYRQCCVAMDLELDDQTVDFLANTGVIFPRGRTLYNLARVSMRELAESVGARWSAQNGALVLIPDGGVRAGEAIVIGPETGLVGIPEATENGVVVHTLLNPNFDIGAPVLIDSSLIVQTVTLNHFRPNLGYVAFASNLNLYRVLAIDHTGDTRGQEWYSDITCLALNADLPRDEQAEGM
jgi:hypothetical protein